MRQEREARKEGHKRRQNKEVVRGPEQFDEVSWDERVVR